MASSGNPFDVGQLAIGGLGQMLDSVELVKRAWSSLSLPTSLVPTMDIGELDKRIADLKAVEQWLNVNLSMLRGTIQGMEIQRGTLAAVQAFGATMGTAPAAAAPLDPAAAAQMRAAAAVQAMDRAVTSASPGPGKPAEGTATRAPAWPQRPSGGSGTGVGVRPAGGAVEPALPGDPDPDDRFADDDATPEGAPSPAPTVAPAIPGLDPGAWWNLLQQNFNQVAEAALSGVGLPGAAGGAAAKPQGKGSSTPAAKRSTGATKPPAGRKRTASKKAAAPVTKRRAGAGPSGGPR